MNVEVALILTVGGIAGAIITTQMFQMNWFKRENFKFDKSQEKKSNAIKFKKLEKELGLKAVKVPEYAPTPGIPDWINVLKKIDPSVAHNFIDGITGGEEDQGEPGAQGMEGMIMEFAKSNPEMVQNFLSGLNKGKGEQQDTITIR